LSAKTYDFYQQRQLKEQQEQIKKNNRFDFSKHVARGIAEISAQHVSNKRFLPFLVKTFFAYEKS
jgi:hypothetical protein